MSVSWKKSYDKPRKYIKKQWYHFAHKDSYNQSYGFSSIIYRCELGHKEGWVQKNLFFWIMVLEKNFDGEGDGTPLQYSCLENPMDGGAWWAAIYGVAQSRTRLKQLSSSRLLRIPWTARRSNQSILKETNSEYSLEGLMLKLKLICIYAIYLSTHWIKPQCWERLKAGREGGSRG